MTGSCLIGRSSVWFPALACLFIAGCPCALGQDESAADFTGRDRLHSYLDRTFLNKTRLVFLLVDTTEDHLQRQPRGWKLGSSGWAARLGSNYGKRLIRNTIELGAGMLLAEDPRYRPSTAPGIAPRVRHAVVSAFVAGGHDGHQRPAYGTFAALTATAFIVSVWQPRRVSTGEVMRGVSFSMLDRVQGRLLEEFAPDMKRFGKRIWLGTRAGGRSLLTRLR